MEYTIKSLALRFLRGAIAGAVSTMVVMTPSIIKEWRDIMVWLSALAIAGIVGAISGGLLAVDKYIRANNSDQSGQ